MFFGRVAGGATVNAMSSAITDPLADAQAARYAQQRLRLGALDRSAGARYTLAEAMTGLLVVAEALRAENHYLADELDTLHGEIDRAAGALYDALTRGAPAW